MLGNNKFFYLFGCCLWSSQEHGCFAHKGKEDLTGRKERRQYLVQDLQLKGSVVLLLQLQGYVLLLINSKAQAIIQ